MEDILLARANLDLFVRKQALKVSSDVGFTWVATDKAPNTFSDLFEAFKNSYEQEESFPIFSGASEHTIYLTQEANYCFRFWHDIVHCQHYLNFTFQDEVEVALIQANDLYRQFGKDSLEYKLFIADTIGQSMYYAIHNEFPTNQLNFVLAQLNKY